jgi:hypothetical protein
MGNETTITAETRKLDYSIVREFEALRGLVFKVFLDPELLMRWPSLHGLKKTVLDK